MRLRTYFMMHEMETEMKMEQPKRLFNIRNAKDSGKLLVEAQFKRLLCLQILINLHKHHFLTLTCTTS